MKLPGSGGRAPTPAGMLAAFFAPALLSLAAAAVTAVLHAAVDLDWGRWLAIHLAFVGGVSQLVLGASQFFVAAFLATTPPSRRLIAAQLALWNAGTLLVAYGVTHAAEAATDAGAALLLAGLGVYAASLIGMQRRSLQRARWAVRWYFAAAALLAPGLVLGVLLARGTAWEHGDLLSAHICLNVGGWFGSAIVGTLHTFFPSLTATRLRFPRLEPVALATWTGGVAVLAGSYAFDVEALSVVGWLSLLVAAVSLAANIGASLGATSERLSAPTLLVAAGQALLLCGVVAGAAGAISDPGTPPFSGPDPPSPAAHLLAGWLALTVVGSLLRLLSLLRRIRSVRHRLGHSSRRVDSPES